MLESVIPLAMAYVVAPATLLMFWARYLVMQDLRAAMLQIVVFRAGADGDDGAAEEGFARGAALDV